MPDSPPPNNEPKVSVLMITYNHEKYIAQAIESVLMQKTDFPYDLIIGEDCSTDGAREIVREYERKYPTIVRTFLPERNVGGHENFRQVFLSSRGRYLAVIEGDDYWTSPEKLQIQADALDAHPETAVCCHRSVWHYNDGSQPDRIWPEIPEGVYELENVLSDYFLNTASLMFRRVIDDVPAWHWSLYMGDIPLFVTLAQYGNIRLLPQTMAVYRIHAGGLWSRLDNLHRARNNQAMFQAFYDHLDPKYRPLIRRKLFWYSYGIGIDSFTAGQLDLTRKCLWECFIRSEPLEHLREKLWLAFKGYGWWTFVFWRGLRRIFRRRKAQ